MVDVGALYPFDVAVDIAVVNLLAACHRREGAAVRDKVIELANIVSHQRAFIFKGRKDIEFLLRELCVEISYESICRHV